MSKNYWEGCRDARWQKLRLKVFERDEFTCQSCEEKDGVELHVHHLQYDFKKSVWETPKEHLVTLCSDCHGEVSGLRKAWLRFRDSLKEHWALEGALGYAVGGHLLDNAETTPDIVWDPKEVPAYYETVFHVAGLPPQVLRPHLLPFWIPEDKFIDAMKKNEPLTGARLCELWEAHLEWLRENHPKVTLVLDEDGHYRVAED